jgi:hypothetical protein
MIFLKFDSSVNVHPSSQLVVTRAYVSKIPSTKHTSLPKRNKKQNEGRTLRCAAYHFKLFSNYSNRNQFGF